jgi:hypothetical protein
MILISFRHSRSKKFPEVLKLAEKFEKYTSDEDRYEIDVSLKEVFEKWEWFNEIFWESIKLVGTVIGYDGMNYYSSRDQKLIFYSLQQAKWNQINTVSFKLVQMYRRYEGNQLFDVKLKGIYDQMMDNLLDNLNKLKAQKRKDQNNLQ